MNDSKETNDENSWTEVELWAEIHRLRAALKGPDGYDSWQDAAVSERVRRVKAERQLSYDEAKEIAFRAAKAFQPSCFNGDRFEPDPWVVHAVISGSTLGQREAAERGNDLFSRKTTN